MKNTKKFVMEEMEEMDEMDEMRPTRNYYYDEARESVLSEIERSVAENQREEDYQNAMLHGD